MRRILLSPAAQSDIEEIWHYSFEKWGHDKAEHYTLGIRATCQSLSDDTKKSRSANIRDGYKKCVYRSHILYFKMDDDAVVIVRILHQSMDADMHL